MGSVQQIGLPIEEENSHWSPLVAFFEVIEAGKSNVNVRDREQRNLSGTS